MTQRRNEAARLLGRGHKVGKACHFLAQQRDELHRAREIREIRLVDRVEHRAHLCWLQTRSAHRGESARGQLAHLVEGCDDELEFGTIAHAPRERSLLVVELRRERILLHFRQERQPSRAALLKRCLVHAVLLVAQLGLRGVLGRVMLASLLRHLIFLDAPLHQLDADLLWFLDHFAQLDDDHLGHPAHGRWRVLPQVDGRVPIILPEDVRIGQPPEMNVSLEILGCTGRGAFHNLAHDHRLDALVPLPSLTVESRLLVLLFLRLVGRRLFGRRLFGRRCLLGRRLLGRRLFRLYLRRLLS